MASEKSIIGIIKKWSTETLLISIIVGGIFGYSELKAYIAIHTFSTPEIKVLTEDFVQKNMGISERQNLEALREMTIKYDGLTNAIDTLTIIYQKSFESIDAYTKLNQHISDMVMNVDSMSVERLNMLKELVKQSKIQSNATQLGLDRQNDILGLLNNFNPSTNFNGD